MLFFTTLSPVEVRTFCHRNLLSDKGDPTPAFTSFSRCSQLSVEQRENHLFCAHTCTLGLVFFKLGTRNVHHKRNQITPIVLLSWKLSWLQSISVIKQIFVVLIKTEPAAELLSWPQYNRCHFVSFVINISGAKFEEHSFNISRDIFYSVFYHFSCKP